MKAVDTNLLKLLKQTERFVVPIYQRIYSWDISECERLWTDIMRAGGSEQYREHFTGSIVYIESGPGSNTSAEPDLIIDGQQRITTVTLVLVALAARLERLSESRKEPVSGFSPEKIREHYLTNRLESGDKFFKINLSKRDKEALEAVISKLPLPETESRVITNYQYFEKRVDACDDDALEALCRGLAKLIVVDVKLTVGIDDPQLVFESMNATGKKLSQADLIRNFVLMGVAPREQETLYNSYWQPMEQAFAGRNEKRFDEFVRHYLTLKTGSIPRQNEIYEAFKEFAFAQDAAGVARSELVSELSQNAKWFALMAFGNEKDRPLRGLFKEIDQLTTVAYPFQLRLYADFISGLITTTEFVKILNALISYVFRRGVCDIATNTLRSTFATLAQAIDHDRYVESIFARLLLMPENRRFPTDAEFSEALRTSDMYNSNRPAYFFRKLENAGRKEEVSVADYSIEHIMPQTLNLVWQQALGTEWNQVHDKYLHTLGNLTLTGYNPEYSNRPFIEKRDIEGGFRQSPLHLNRGLADLDQWNETTIIERSSRLATQATKIWSRPALTEVQLSQYRDSFRDSQRFDWSQTHSILSVIPEGNWTSYNQLAEAVGTGAQAMANHLATCAQCLSAYRVLTWDGRISDDFRWIDPNDNRDPKELLRSEGIRVIEGKADPEQQLLSSDLLVLIASAEG